MSENQSPYPAPTPGSLEVETPLGCLRGGNIPTYEYINQLKPGTTMNADLGNNAGRPRKTDIP